MADLLVTLDPTVSRMAEALIRACETKRIKLRVTQGRRTYAEQEAIYAQGRSAPGAPCIHDGKKLKPGECAKHPYGLPVSFAPPGYSWHNFGRAFDVAIVDYPGDLDKQNVYDGPWAVVGALGEEVGLEWGGYWKTPDRPHFQFTGGTSLAQMREMKERGELVA